MRRPTVLVLNPPLKLREVARKLHKKVRLIRGSYRDIEVVFAAGEVRILIKKEDVRKFDYVWVSGSWSKRDMAHALSLYLTYYKRPHTVVNEGAGTSKLVDMMSWALAHLPQPKSYYCVNSEYLRRAEEIATVCKFPLIAKDVRGTFGRKSFLAKNIKELKTKLFEADESTYYIFQEFIPNEYDWGIIVGNGKVLSAEKSYRNLNDETFMNHASGGATEVFVSIQKVPTEISKLAIRASELLDLTWARSDILVHSATGKPYLLETNRSPRMTSKSTEVDAFAEFIGKLIENERTA